MIACEPSTSCVTAFPMSWRKAPRLAIAGSTPISAASALAMCDGLDEVLQNVLAVAGAVLETAQELDELRMDVREADLGNRVLAGLPDLLVEVAHGPLVDLLDPRRLDPAVLHELLEGHPRRLAAHGVEAREHDGLGRVVDDDVDAGGGLERADVPSFAADDPPLHVLARQREDADARLRRLLGRDPLDGDRHDLPGTFLALLPGTLLDLTHLGHRAALRFVDHLRGEQVPGLVRGHPRDALQLRPVLLGRLLELLPNEGQLVLALLQLLGPSVHPLTPVTEVCPPSR